MSDRRWDPAAVSKTSVLSPRSGDARSGDPLNAAAWRRSSRDGGDARAPRLSTHNRAPRRRTRHTRVAEGKGSPKVDPDVSRRHAADLGCRRDGSGISASGSNACGFHLTPTPRAPYIDLLPVLLSLIDRHWQGDTFTKKFDDGTAAMWGPPGRLGC